MTLADKLLSETDDAELCDGVFCRFADKDNTIQADRYEESERIVTLVWHATGLLDNGGFHYLLEGDFNGDPGFVYTAAAFKAVGADRAYQAFQEVLRLFPGGVLPADIKMRLEVYERVPKDERVRIDRLFWSDSEVVPQRLAQYIRHHKDTIKRLLDAIAEPDAGGNAAAPRASA